MLCTGHGGEVQTAPEQQPEALLFSLGRELAVPSCPLPRGELARLQLGRRGPGVRGAPGHHTAARSCQEMERSPWQLLHEPLAARGGGLG